MNADGFLRFFFRRVCGCVRHTHQRIVYGPRGFAAPQSYDWCEFQSVIRLTVTCI
jgi:hypothetical protein